MIFDGTLVKALSASRRRIMPPTPPQQGPQPSLEGTPRQMEVEDQEFGGCEKNMRRASVDGTRLNNIRTRVTTCKWKLRSWSFCLLQKIQRSTYHRGQKIAKLIIFELMLAIS